MIVRLYSDLESKKVYEARPPAEVHAMFDEPLPRAPGNVRALLETIERDVFGAAMLNISPNFLAYVTGGASQVGILGDMLGAALNQNCTLWHIAASAAAIEQQAIRWIAEFIGYPSDTGGVFTSGGSVANLTCLAAARRAKAPFDVANAGMNGGPPLTMYTSAQGHSCLDKSLDMLGLGKAQLRKIPVREDLTVDVHALENQVIADRSAGFHPICVIGNAGTVNTGAVDPLHALADVCARHDLWFHVDGAYGGPAAATDIAGELFRGIERADSVVLDPHKWLYVPFEAGCALVKDARALRDTYSLIPEYLRSVADESGRIDFMEYSMQLSRGFRALKVWMTFKAYGADTLRAAIEDKIETMRHLARLVDESDDFERLAPVPLSAVCFRYVPSDGPQRHDQEYVNTLNKRLLDAVEKDGRVYVAGTMLQGKTALRACSITHRTEKRHVEYLLAVLRELGSALKE